MTRYWRTIVLTLVGVVLYLPLKDQAWTQRGEVRRGIAAGYVIPSQINRALALEHRGLLSDYIMLKTITFFGERVMFDEQLSEEDWHYIIRSLEAVTDLDPYFLDPYIMAEGLLAWEAGEVQAANRLLKKGWRYRQDNWQLPFYIGFNYFYFLGNNEKGSEYLMEAAKLPESPKFLPTLAARLGYYGGKTETALVFLKGMLAQTTDDHLRSRLEKRLLALERAAYLEEAVEKFRAERGSLPRSVDALILEGYLDRLPEEPYGGEWKVLPSGRIYSTSKFSESYE